MPTDIASTGWPAVRKTCVQKLGIEFDDWQDGAGRVMLAKRADGSLAAMIDGVGLSLPRQVGKTYLVGAMIFALCINTPNLLVIWSAHHARTHGETFLAMQGFAGRQKVAAYVKQIFTGSGTEEILFHNGSRILFGARERGFGRGIPGVDALIFDEAQILSDKALSNMLATMNTSHFGLQLYIGTPPKPDDMSESFTRMRNEAIAGTLLDGAWIELGGKQGADPDDRKQWPIANPSHPKRTPIQSILRLKRKLTPEDFLREGLGVWDDGEKTPSAISRELWASRYDGRSSVAGLPSFGLDVSPKMTFGAIGVVGSRPDRGLHGEILLRDGQPMLDYRPGVDWIVPAFKDLLSRRGAVNVAIASGSQAETLAPALRAIGVTVDVIPRQDVASACGLVHQFVTDGTLSHSGQPELATAVAGGQWRDSGEGAQIFGRVKSTADITALYALALAVWSAHTKPPLDDVTVAFL